MELLDSFHFVFSSWRKFYFYFSWRLIIVQWWLRLRNSLVFGDAAAWMTVVWSHRKEQSIPKETSSLLRTSLDWFTSKVPGLRIKPTTFYWAICLSSCWLTAIPVGRTEQKNNKQCQRTLDFDSRVCVDWRSRTATTFRQLTGKKTQRGGVAPVSPQEFLTNVKAWGDRDTRTQSSHPIVCLEMALWRNFVIHFLLNKIMS